MAGTSHTVSLPREHGALITLAGAVALALWLAPERADAALAGIAIAAGFLTRGPIERRAGGGRLLAGDRWLLIACAALAAAALALLAASTPVMGLAAGLAALVFPAAGAVTRVLRVQRSLLVE